LWGQGAVRGGRWEAGGGRAEVGWRGAESGGCLKWRPRSWHAAEVATGEAEAALARAKGSAATLEPASVTVSDESSATEPAWSTLGTCLLLGGPSERHTAASGGGGCERSGEVVWRGGRRSWSAAFAVHSRGRGIYSTVGAVQRSSGVDSIIWAALGVGSGSRGRAGR
jgi:hypothetical protein